MKKLAWAFLLAFTVVISSQGQILIASNSFEGADTWALVAGSAQISTTNSGNDSPASGRIRTGVRSWQSINASNSFDLASIDIGSSFTARQVSVRLASISTNGTNGAESSDNVDVFVATDGATFAATPNVRISGNNNARWAYSSTNFVHILSTATVSNMAPQTGGPNLNNYSLLQIDLPDSVTSVAVRVIARNNASQEAWCLDDIEVLRDVPGWIGVAPTNTAPTFSPAVVNRTTTNGASLVFNVSALDLTDNDEITLSASNLPGSATFAAVTNFSGVTNAFSWNPVDAIGVFTTTFHAVDNDGVTVATSIITSVSAPLVATNFTEVWINEINYDPALTGDTNEFVEIAGKSGTTLTNLFLFHYNGADGAVISATLALPPGVPLIPDPGCGVGAVSTLFITNDMQQGPDGVALVRIEAGSTSVIQFLSYEGAFQATAGPASGYLSIHVGGQTNADTSLQLVGTGTNYTDFVWVNTNVVQSPGALNNGQIISPCVGGNTPPSFQPIGNKIGTNNTLLTFDVVALDIADNDIIELSASNLPGGASFNTVTNAGGVTNTFVWFLAGPPGVYTTDFYAVDDDGVTVSNVLITIRDPPSILITNVNETVPYAVTTFTIGGTASTNVNGEFTWTNTLNGGTGTIPASSPWSISGIGISVGANAITVRGSNVFSETTSASVTITRSQPEVPGCIDVISHQGFESTTNDTWTIVDGSLNVFSAPGTLDTPPLQRIAQGTSSWQLVNTVVTLELAQVSMANYTGRYVRARLSSTSATTGNGADGGDNVRFYVALDGAAFAPLNGHDIFIKGNSNARWGYWASNSINTFAGTSVSNAAPQANQSSNNVSTINLLIPDSATSVAFRVIARNDDTDEIWNLDDIGLFGCTTIACTDCDNDGLDDAWEVAYFGSTATATNAAEDADVDGFSNIQEFFAKSNPNDFSSKLVAEAVTNAPVGFIVTWQSHTGATYVVGRATNLIEGFTGIESNIAATPPANTYTDGAAGPLLRFYNVTVP